MNQDTDRFRQGLVNRIENYGAWIADAESRKEWASRSIFQELRYTVMAILEDYDERNGMSKEYVDYLTEQRERFKVKEEEAGPVTKRDMKSYYAGIVDALGMSRRAYQNYYHHQDQNMPGDWERSVPVMNYQDKLARRVENYKSMANIKYKVWNAINPPAIMDYYIVDTPEEAAEMIVEMSNDQLDDDNIHSNAFGLEVYDSLHGVWEEWDNEDGHFPFVDSIDDLIDLISGERMREANYMDMLGEDKD